MEDFEGRFDDEMDFPEVDFDGEQPVIGADLYDLQRDLAAIRACFLLGDDIELKQKQCIRAINAERRKKELEKRRRQREWMKERERERKRDARERTREYKQGQKRREKEDKKVWRELPDFFERRDEERHRGPTAYFYSEKFKPCKRRLVRRDDYVDEDDDDDDDGKKRRNKKPVYFDTIYEMGNHLTNVRGMSCPVYLTGEGASGFDRVWKTSYLRDHLRMLGKPALKDNRIEEPGNVEIDDDEISIRLTQKGHRKMSEDEKYVRCFLAQFDEKAESMWAANNLQYEFYPDTMYPRLGKKGDTPFDWAFLRSKLAFSYVENGDSDLFESGDMPLHFTEHPFKTVAQQMFDTIPKDLKRPRKFKIDGNRQKILDAMESAGFGHHPDMTYFFMKLKDSASQGLVLSNAARKMHARIDFWISNGLDINRAVEMFEFVMRKRNNRFQALEVVVAIVDNIWGQNKRPWYFVKNFNPFAVYAKAKSEHQGKYRAAMGEDDIQAVEEFSKYAGYDFEYGCKAYFQGGCGLEKFMPKKRTIEITCFIASRYGIGNMPRAIRIIDIMILGLGKLNASEQEVFIKQFLEHVDKNEPRSEITCKMEGDEVTVPFPGLDFFKATLDGSRDKMRERKLDLQVLDAKLLRGIWRQFNAMPEAERLGMALDFDQDNLAASHMLPHNASAAIAALPYHREGGMEVSKPARANIVSNAMNLYDRCKEETGSVDEDVLRLYFAMFANAMRDPFNPPKNFLKLIKTIKEIPESVESVNRRMFERDGRGPRDEASVRTVRLCAVRILIDFYNRGAVTDEQMEKLIEHAVGDNIGFNQAGVKQSEWDFIYERLNKWEIDHMESNERIEAEGEGEHCADFRDQGWVKATLYHLSEQYHRELLDAFSGTLNFRWDNIAGAMQAIVHYKSLIEVMNLGDIFNYREIMEGLVSEALNTPDQEGEDQYTADKDVMLNPYKLPRSDEDEWENFTEALKEGIEDGLIDAEAVKEEMRSAKTSKDRIAMLESFYKMVVGMRQLIYAANDIDFETIIDNDGNISEYAAETIVKANETLKAINVKYFNVERFVRQKTLKSKFDILIKFNAFKEIDDIVERYCGKKAEVRENIEQENARKALKSVLTFFGIARVVDFMEREGGKGAGRDRVLAYVNDRIDETPALPAGGDIELGAMIGDTIRSVHDAMAFAAKQVGRQFGGQVIELKRAIEAKRSEYKGVLPVGGKVHLLHGINSKEYDRLFRLLRLTSSAFKLEAATNSFIIPPVMTQEEMIIILACLEETGLLDKGRPELQVTIPGKLDDNSAAILGSSILLSTEVGMEYPLDSFKTSHDEETDKRIMAYDDGGELIILPHMRRRKGWGYLSGRTDMFGRKAWSDIKYYQFISTALSNAQFGGPFEEIGKWYIAEYENLLERHKMKDILEDKWINKQYDDEWCKMSAKKKEESRKHHYETVKRCTDAWYKCAENPKDKKGIIFEVRDLVDSLMEKMAVIQETLTGEEYEQNPLQAKEA